MQPLTDVEYDALAFPELKALVQSLDDLEEPTFEAELAGDILTLEFDDGAKYVINSHRAARQIWMAAEHSAWHFDWRPETRSWIANKSGDELWSTLSGTLSKKLGRPVTLER